MGNRSATSAIQCRTFCGYRRADRAHLFGAAAGKAPLVRAWWRIAISAQHRARSATRGRQYFLSWRWHLLRLPVPMLWSLILAPVLHAFDCVHLRRAK